MDPEKNEFSTKSPLVPSVPTELTCFRRERLKKRFLNVLLYVSSAFILLAVFHTLALHEKVENPSSFLHAEDGKHGHRLTMKEREELFLYVAPLAGIVCELIRYHTKLYPKLRKRYSCVESLCNASPSCRFRDRLFRCQSYSEPFPI